MKKLILVALITINSIAQAENKEITLFPNLKLKDGINIVKMADIKVAGDIPNSDDRSIKLKGYIETSELDKNISSLFSLKKEAPNEIKSFDDYNDPLDTHLKSSYKKIPLSFKYSGIPKIAGRVIGFAAAGGYSNEQGWDGIVAFFEDKNLGICSYTTYAIKKVLLGEEKTEYLVNDKPSVKSIKGNRKSGFLYSLNWYENDRLHAIECANKEFNSDIQNGLINLAKKIDKN